MKSINELKMTKEQLHTRLYSKGGYVSLLIHLKDHANTIVDGLLWGDFDENELYDLIEELKDMCDVIAKDSRGTGTLLKDFQTND